MLSRRILLTASNYHRGAGCMRDRGADRSECHAGEPAPAVAADDHKLRTRGEVDQVSGRPVVHHGLLNAHPG